MCLCVCLLVMKFLPIICNYMLIVLVCLPLLIIFLIPHTMVEWQWLDNRCTTTRRRIPWRHPTRPAKATSSPSPGERKKQNSEIRCHSFFFYLGFVLVVCTCIYVHVFSFLFWLCIRSFWSSWSLVCFVCLIRLMVCLIVFIWIGVRSCACLNTRLFCLFVWINVLCVCLNIPFGTINNLFVRLFVFFF